MNLEIVSCGSCVMAEQFPLRYLLMKQFEELSANVLKCRKFLQIVAGIPPGRGSIERQCELRNFGCLNLSNDETLCRMVGLPSRHKSSDVGFRIRAIRIPGIWVRHGVEVQVFW